MPDHAAALANLAFGEFVAFALERVFGAFEYQFDGRTYDIQRFPEVIDQKPLVTPRHLIDLIAVNDDGGRIGAALMGELEFDGAPAPAAADGQ